MERQKCLLLFSDLLRERNNIMNCNDQTKISLYIKKFFDTEKCDKYFDFSKHRNLYKSYFDKLKIYNNSKNKDIKIKKQALFHYYFYDTYDLVKSLFWIK